MNPTPVKLDADALTLAHRNATPTGPVEGSPSTAIRPARLESRYEFDEDGGPPMRHTPVEDP